MSSGWVGFICGNIFISLNGFYPVAIIYRIIVGDKDFRIRRSGSCFIIFVSNGVKKTICIIRIVVFSNTVADDIIKMTDITIGV